MSFRVGAVIDDGSRRSGHQAFVVCHAEQFLAVNVAVCGSQRDQVTTISLYTTSCAFDV